LLEKCDVGVVTSIEKQMRGLRQTPRAPLIIVPSKLASPCCNRFLATASERREVKFEGLMSINLANTTIAWDTDSSDSYI
jgi:hypothetical protein